MSNDRTLHIGENVKDSIIAVGDKNVINVNLPQPLSPPEPPRQIDYDRLPLPSSELIGRSKELTSLDRAFEDPKEYVISIIAGGGVGKSALTYSWLDKLKPEYGGAKLIFGWSFYSQGSHETQNSSAPFFQQALKFFGYDKEFPKDEVEKGKELAKCLREKPCLLILDGMEPLQHPVKILNGEIRDTALKELLRCVRLYGLSDKSLVVISSRQPIVEYEQWKQGYEKIDLNVLNDMQGADLLKTLGANGSCEDLQNASKDMGGHALSLVLLGNLLAERFGGDVNRRDRLPNLFKDEKHGGHALRILRYYEEYWQETDGNKSPELTFMCLLGLFDRPMGLCEKRELCEKAEFAKPLAALNDNEFKALEKRLEKAGLLLKSDKSGIRTEWDCHPLIRNYFGQVFRNEEEKAFQQAHSVLFEYYQSAPKKILPDTLDEMEPLYRAVVHGCLAGEHSKALIRVYYERILRSHEHYSYRTLGSYSQDLTAICAFFPEGWGIPLCESVELSRWLLSQASLYLMSLGRLSEAVELAKLHKLLCEDIRDAVVCSENLVDIYLLIGSIKDAVRVAWQSIGYTNLMLDNLRLTQGNKKLRKIFIDYFKSNHYFFYEQVITHSNIASTLYLQGDLKTSLDYFQKAEKIQKKEQPEYARLYSLSGAEYCSLLSDMSADTTTQEAILARGQYALGVALYGSQNLQDIALSHLTIASALFALNRFDKSYAEFDEAIRAIQKADKINFLPKFLLTRARFSRHQQQFPEAWHDLVEANEIIERCGMKLYAVDANLLEGNLFLDKDDGNEAMKCYKQAKELIEYTGYHLRDAELDLLAARLADACQDSEKAQYHLDKSYQSIERIGYWGFLPEWERVKSSFRRKSDSKTRRIR